MSLRNERGAAAVEFALVVPLLVLLLVGIIEFGRAYQVQTTLSGAAREGVRVMALTSKPADSRAAVQAAATGLGVTDAQIAVSPTSCAVAAGADAPTATVVITYQYQFLTGMIGSTVTLTGRGVMRCNG